MLPLEQIVSLVGAAFILAAFVTNTFGKFDAESMPYQAMNLVGGACLAYSAIVTRQYGFIVLESAWVLISLYGIARALRTRS
ncbi:MAG TPA: hypothetical protein V6D47_19805 [Oscillatoriaceae cyanobacterium]